MSTCTKDNVNHPKHYDGNTSLECIDVMTVCMGIEAVINFCLCNAFKYMWRYKNKNGEEDLKKTRWYLDWVKNKMSVDYYNTELENRYERLEYLYSQLK